jgi:hypothetical protein
MVVMAGACPAGQTLINGKCGEVEFIEGCINYIGRTQCGGCEFNYQLNGGICDYLEQDKAKCCIGYGANGECNQCEKGLFLKDGGCLQSNLVGCIEKDFGSCLNCATGFYLQNKRCVRGVTGCSAYDNNGVCQKCLSGFSI